MHSHNKADSDDGFDPFADEWQPTKSELKILKQKKNATEKDEDFDPFAEDDEDEDEKARLAAIADKAKASKKKKVVVAKSLIILEIKPWGPETDLDKLAKKVLKEVAIDGLVWKTEFKKEPVAYGVFKIVIGCVVEDEKVSVDDIQE